MKFYADYKSLEFSGKLAYENNEFIYEPYEFSDFSVMLSYGYNSLDVNLKTNQIVSLSGYNECGSWKNFNVSPPSFKEGILQVVFDEVQISGSGISYAENWPTYYNSSTGWVCIGDPLSPHNQAVCFASGTVAVLLDNDLVSIWLKPKIL